ncbi:MULTISPECIES: class I SAM-dependent DNA methyltransferase [unclassified Prochlorococcus]|uniref:class I SAM-dependent DNA methyltransferase n=1 Tax=unclassified Prochlorococcus TaxID=2627481 RepID=UPI00097CCC48|nr:MULTISPECIES: type I restriction-modification system subunit M [unclassified Prochlorococcus]AQL29941.1 type I restriction endonuclease subunit M [Prochlorococcus sp. RS50]AQL33119.1 type I restriction endonuclease subunit M [Prochlorococcus sp. RS01]AQL34381.1 type I restriction endonuclease subunit M [Prochlorococcus sp. RS04]
MYEEAFKNIDDVFWKDAGCSSELDYIEQTSWILFLKYLDDYEEEKETAAILNGETYERIIDKEFRWKEWAYPKTFDGKLNYDIALTGNDLLEFVNKELFPHLAGFKQSAENPRSIDYKIGEIFSELRNKLQSGYSLRDVINKVNDLKFLSNKEKLELSSLYEDKIKNMGNAGRNGGEYYTPRPLIKSIVKVINPQIGETVYDGAVGSAGFLCEAFDWMSTSKELNAAEFQQLQNNTFFGKEKKSLAYVIGIMNMILHGVEAPNIVHKNTLAENLADVQEKERVDVILANPPFGGKERSEIQQNFPIKTSETAYLFLQHFIKMMKPGGRCGVVIKNTFLSNGDNASIALRKQLLEECNLFAVLDLPQGSFIGTGVKTVVLFFEKGKPTEQIWCYQLDVGRSMGKTNPLNEDDLIDFVKKFKTKEEAKNSWMVDIEKINSKTWDLTLKNPNIEEKIDNRSPQEIIDEIKILDLQADKALQKIKELL